MKITVDWKKPIPKRVCLTCKLRFNQSHHLQKYHDPTCNPRYRSIVLDQRNRICKQCQTEYTPIRNKQEFCSPQCRKMNWWTKNKNRYYTPKGKTE